MSSATPARLAVLCLAVWLSTAGCGPNAASPSARISGSAPQRIVLANGIRPMPLGPIVEQPADETQPVPAQFQQPHTTAAPGRPRIVELSKSNQASPATDSAIREPGAKPPEVTEPISASNPLRRSEFVPITMPQPTVPPSAAASPQFPQKPVFAVKEAPPMATPPSVSAVAQPTERSAPPIAASPLVQQPAPPGLEAPANDAPAARPEAVAVQPALPPQLATSGGPQAAPHAADTAPIGNPTEPQFANQVAARPDPVAVQDVVSPHSIPVGPVQSAAIQSVALRALQMADQASAMAQRGMLYSARTELIQALQLIIQALDVQERDSRHAAALAAGLAALDEARDFSAKSARPGESVNVSTVATSHRTPVLKGEGNTITSPVVAQQQYFAYAQTQLVAAAGGVPAASQILYRLGRLQTVMALHDVDPLALHAPQAIVFHQSSLVTDGGNYQAANELGVLLARYGQLPEARRLLILSVSTRPQVETWQNLSVVHRRLGEFDLAVRADHERQLLAKQLEQAPDSSSDMIRWVDPQTFAASGGPEVQVPALTATKPAATPTAARR